MFESETDRILVRIERDRRLSKAPGGKSRGRGRNFKGATTRTEREGKKKSGHKGGRRQRGAK